MFAYILEALPSVSQVVEQGNLFQQLAGIFMLYVGHAVMTNKKWRISTVKEVRLTN